MLTSDSPNSAAVTGGAAPARVIDTRFEEALAVAFPEIDAPEDAMAQLADSPADPRLLEVTPLPRFILLEELLRAIASARVLIIKRVGVPLTTIVSLGVAMVLHLLLLGGFILAGYVGFLIPRGEGNSAHSGSEGGSGSGYMIMGEGPQGPPVLAGTVENLLAHGPASPPAAILPPLPRPEMISSEPLPVIDAVKLPLPPAEPEIIGMVSGESMLGRPKPVARASISPPALVVAPPSSHAGSSSSSGIASGSTGKTASSPRGGAGEGGGDEGPVLSLFLPGTHGSGTGKGNRIGSGIDRGESGANNPNPSVLDAPQLWLPDEFSRNPPKANAVFEVTVLPTGKAGTITLTQSCGVADIDVLCRANIQRYRFRPAYLAGKPVEKTMTITQNFRSLH